MERLWQATASSFVRNGYFCIDSKDSTPENLVFNRIVSLKSSLSCQNKSMNELTISLKTDSKVPLYEQIYAYIRGDIRSGRIPCGEKLPSTRALSRHLEVSRSTVELAYEQLLSEGYLESEPCRGYFAARIDDLYRLDRPGRLERREQESEKAPASCEEKENYLFDFTPNGVDVDSFPYNVWRKLSKDILKDNRTELFRTGDSKGEEGFRRAIASYLYQARGVECRPEQIIIGAGNDYMLMLLGTILGPDRKLAFEDPTYMQACRLFECLSYETVPVSMDKSGMRVDRLALTDADIAYVTPSHQYPTGIVMPVGRRQELLKWADQAENRYIIEDDYDSEFRYKGKPIPALQGMDAMGKSFTWAPFPGPWRRPSGSAIWCCLRRFWTSMKRKTGSFIPRCPRWTRGSWSGFWRRLL